MTEGFPAAGNESSVGINSFSFFGTRLAEWPASSAKRPRFSVGSDARAIRARASARTCRAGTMLPTPSGVDILNHFDGDVRTAAQFPEDEQDMRRGEDLQQEEVINTFEPKYKRSSISGLNHSASILKMPYLLHQGSPVGDGKSALNLNPTG